ncbi:MAG: dynamin family protein [Cyanobacteria bacterium J06639_1]
MDDAISQLRQALVAATTELDERQESDARLDRDIRAACARAAASASQIAVFGPFNHGKSTLLNALLGQPLLPMDLIPTTGAAIRVKYGEALRSRLTLRDGTVRDEAGTEMLQEFATLDERRTMRDDVSAVEITCPHPLLEKGIELLDLPGTNDRKAQNELVAQKLLGTDWVVQVLDGRKLMTLGEREHLRDWLLERGIETVIFVVNFLNLMEEPDRKEVMRRMRFVAESFRSNLPPNVVNLYRVDALPALRSRLNNDEAGLETSGLTAFATALEQLAPAAGFSSLETQLPRLKILARTTRDLLHNKASAMSAQAEANRKRSRERDLQKRGQALIQQGFATSALDARQALSADALCDRFQSELEAALRQGQVDAWRARTLDPLWRECKAKSIEWVNQAGNLFQQAVPTEPGAVAIPTPSISTPPASSSTPSTDPKPRTGDAAVAAATGLGFLMGGPLGAAVLGGASYVLNRSDRNTDAPSAPTPPPEVDPSIYSNAARAYLQQFSLKALAALQQYGAAAAPILNYEIAAAESDLDSTAALDALNAKIAALDSALATG